MKTIAGVLLLSSMEFASICLALFIEEENICKASQECFKRILLLTKYVIQRPVSLNIIEINSSRFLSHEF